MKKMVRLSTTSHLWMILTLLFVEGVVFLEPKKIINEIQGSTSVTRNHTQGSHSVC